MSNGQVIGNSPTITLCGVVPGSRYAILERDTNRVLVNEIAEDEIVQANVDIGPVIVRVRNRDFRSFETDIEVTGDSSIAVFQTPDTFAFDNEVKVKPPSQISLVFRKAIDMLFNPDIDWEDYK